MNQNSLIQLPVFVYGTLRKGFGNHHFLHGKTEKMVMGALVEGAIYPVRSGGGFPCLVEQVGTVVGELMYIRPEFYEATLERLDMLEGYRGDDNEHSMYIRKKKMVQANGEEIEAWVYVWNTGYRILRTDRISSGCWKTFEQQRKADNGYTKIHDNVYVKRRD